jgi:hypothetical protein
MLHKRAGGGEQQWARPTPVPRNAQQLVRAAVQAVEGGGAQFDSSNLTNEAVIFLFGLT